MVVFFNTCKTSTIYSSACNEGKNAYYLQNVTKFPNCYIRQIFQTRLMIKFDVSYLETSIFYLTHNERRTTMKVSHATKYCLDYYTQNSKKKHNS